MKKKLLSFFLLLLFVFALGACSPRNPPTEFSVDFFTDGGGVFPTAIRAEIEECPMPQKKGYAFEGWYETADFMGKSVVFPYLVTRNITLYAKYIDLNEGNEEIKYTLDETGNYVAASYGGSSPNVVIPANYNGKPVKRVASGFLRNITQIVNFYIGRNVETIDEKFYFCPNFESFYLIDSNDFFTVYDGILYRGTESLVCYPPAKKYSDGAFSLPEGVTRVERDCFRNVKAIEILRLGNSFRYAEENFSHLTNLRRFEVNNNDYFLSREGILYDPTGKILLSCPPAIGKKCTVPANTERITDGALNGNRSEELALNSSLESFGVHEGFELLTTVSVAEGNARYFADDGILYDVALNSLVLYPPARPDETFTVKNVEIIDKNAFSGSKFLAELTIAPEVKRILQFAFDGSYVCKIRFEEGSSAEFIDETAFYNTVYLSELYMTALTPPVFDGEEVSFKIYVPAEAYDDYFDEWRNQSARLRPLTEA